MELRVAALPLIRDDLGLSINTLHNVCPKFPFRTIKESALNRFLETFCIVNGRPVTISGRPSQAQRSTGPISAVDRFSKVWSERFFGLGRSTVNSPNSRPLSEPVEISALHAAVDRTQTGGPPFPIFLKQLEQSISYGRLFSVQRSTVG